VELDQLKWHGEQVFRTLAHNAMASRAIVEQLMPLLPKYIEEAMGKVMHLYALLEAATLMDPAFVNEAEKQGQGTSCHQRCHSQSMRNDVVNSSSSSREWRDQDPNERDLCNII
jgi:hypothetical protein